VKLKNDPPSKADLVDAIYKATKDAYTALVQEFPENFYYFALITTGEAHAPFVAAWSYEALAKFDKDLKWSYADSPYCLHKEELFDEVKSLFALRPFCAEENCDEYQFRISAMELALQKLDQENIFGKGEKRKKILINVEVVPPDVSNTERARRLNPPEALVDWLNEAAE
jgi:hypothetical protein